MKIIRILFIKIVLLSLSLFALLGCKKEFLNKKPNTGIVVPATIDDMIQLLDNNEVITRSGPAMAFMSADEYYYQNIETYNSIPSKTARNCYIWNRTIFDGELGISDWNKPYEVIFYANVVLDEWNKLSGSDKESEQGRYVKAWAFFLRSFAFYNLVQIFSPTYNALTADRDLGVPIKLTANINDIVQRSSLKATYKQIIDDLEASVNLYTDVFPSSNRNRPSKPALFALLSRVYLSMREYDKALAAANRSLSYYDKLVDYNTLSKTSSTPFDKYNAELLFQHYAASSNSEAIGVTAGKQSLDRNLIQFYDNSDLRKVIFFRNVNNEFYAKRIYVSNGGYPFTGLATDEVYLIKAECLARAGDYRNSMDVLNILVKRRWDKSVSYSEIVATNEQEALKKVLLERRKELIWRGLRWSDLKRLNLEGAEIPLTRNLNGVTYTLPPNDPRYVLPIPDDEVAFSKIIQNNRNNISN